MGEDVTTVAIVTRRLKEGKTYDDFRKAWYHTIGFGASNKMYTMVNAFDEREIIVIGFTDMDSDVDPMSVLRIDVKERLANPLDEVIEPEIRRTFGILISEDDFSKEGTIDYKPPSVGGKETNVQEIIEGLKLVKQAILKASRERDALEKGVDPNTRI